MSIKEIISFPFRLTVAIVAFVALAAVLIILSPIIAVLFIVENLKPPRLGRIA